MTPHLTALANEKGIGRTNPESDQGPFKGVWYVEQTHLRVKRQVLINQYVLPKALRPWGETGFYEKNKALGYDVDGYLAAIRTHEGKRGLCEDALEGDARCVA